MPTITKAMTRSATQSGRISTPTALVWNGINGTKIARGLMIGSGIERLKRSQVLVPIGKAALICYPITTRARMSIATKYGSSGINTAGSTGLKRVSKLKWLCGMMKGNRKRKMRKVGGR